jgi:hypothetical protein
MVGVDQDTRGLVVGQHIAILHDEFIPLVGP